MFEIEKGIPMIAKATGRATKFPFNKMEVGDSFLVLRDQIKSEGAFRVSARSYGVHHNKKFSVRKVENGFRCWRIE